MSNNVRASTARMAGVLLLIVAHSAPVFAKINSLVVAQSQPQPRDPRPSVTQPVPSREQELRDALKTAPANVAAWLELAKLQEARGAMDDAERTFTAALSATGGAREVLMSMSAFFNRLGNFQKTIAPLEQVAAENPTDSVAHHTVAVYYWDKAYRDLTLSPADKLMYIEAGVAATDRALALKPDFVDSLVFKNLLLRLKANFETDAARRQGLIAEADALRSRAMELNKARTDGAATASPSPPPPPPPPPPGQDTLDEQQPVRVGGNIKPPTKIHDVSPVYPPDAIDARISGVVILETLIDGQGNVRSARVLRSIPLLDQAAIDAVKGWRFTPTLLNGVAVPVIMTVTVNFSLK